MLNHRSWNNPGLDLKRRTISWRPEGHADVSVRHFVPPGRLTRKYFREWFFWHGKTQALMLEDLHPDLEMSQVPRIAGIPRFLYRQTLEQCWQWIKALGHKDALGVVPASETGD